MRVGTSNSCCVIMRVYYNRNTVSRGTAKVETYMITLFIIDLPNICSHYMDKKFICVIVFLLFTNE